MMRFPCPNCGMTLSAPEDCAGRTSKCRCGTVVIVPDLSAPQAPPPPKEKTALGQVVAHTPTNLALEPDPVDDPMSPPKLARPTPPRTTVGQVVAHVPTAIAKGPSPPRRKETLAGTEHRG